MPAPVVAAASFGRALGESAASTGTTGLITGALGQLFGGMNARRQWRFQQKQMKLQQQYALEQMQKQSELSYANWQKQFDYENAYNDPSKVFDRYLKAGVTPAAVLGSSGVGVNATMSGGSSSTPYASAPNGGAPITPGGFAPADPTSIAQNMVAQSTVSRNAAAANRDNAEAQSINDQNVGNQLYTLMAQTRVALDQAATKHNLAVADVLKVQESIERNALFISDATLLSTIDEKKNQAALVAAEVRRMGIENEHLGAVLSAQAFMMRTQAVLNQALGDQAREVIESLRLNNLDAANELVRNWDKRFDVEIPNPQYSENLRSKNPIVRGNPGPATFKVSMSLKDFYDKTTINEANASDFLPEQARIALRNAKVDPYVEISKALVGAAASVAGAGIIRGGMSRAATSISAGGSSNSVAGSSMTTRYDSKGRVVGYATTEMNRSGHSSTYNNTRRSR
jgi:hypothetical protein